MPALRRCAKDQHGSARVELAIVSDGHVSEVELRSGAFAEAPVTRCLGQMSRKARCGRFTQPVFRVRYPFTI